jgi:uncharacterized protein YcfJ
MNERFNTLPSHDDFAKIVTREELEDTLQGIRQDCRNLSNSLPCVTECEEVGLEG